MMRRFFLGPVFLLLFIGSAAAALVFPDLTGRVVDQAHILSASTIDSLTQELAQHEAATTNQVVVVTLSSLQNTEIEEFGYLLGRHWGIGQKGKDNGVLLLVAPKEKKVRIEVGYGLEGTLTDALASEIIQGTILPDFRAGKMEQGVVDGTQAILDTLTGTQSSTGDQFNPNNLQFTSEPRHIDWGTAIWMIIIFVAVIGKIVLLCSPSFYKNHPLLAMFLLIGSGGSSGGGGGGFGGGFSGGGGGFGGGGASGGW